MKHSNLIGKSMLLWKRFLWLLLPLLIQSFYFPLNLFSKGGFAPISPLDAYIPVWPAWVLPYLLTIPWWIASFLWAAFGMEDRQFRMFIVSSSLAILCGILTFAFFPTYVIRPEITRQGGAWEWLWMLYASDNIYNALPSGHAYITMTIVIFWWSWKPNLRPLWAATLIVVLLSTLFTHQHYILDLLAGVLLAVVSSIFVNWLVGKEKKDSLRLFLVTDKSS